MRVHQSDLHNFLFLGRENCVDLFDMCIGCLLHIIGLTLFIVFADGFVLQHFLQNIDAVAALPGFEDLVRACARVAVAVGRTLRAPGAVDAAPR